MNAEPLRRKLAAILYADVAGYSRLTGADEEGTHRRLRTYLDATTDLIVEYGGTVMHYAGDAVLANFPSVIDAVLCGLSVQREIAVLNAALPDARRLEFRIGINLGDVILDRNDIYGDGVNVAARLEALAQPGGICVSGTVYDALGTKLPVEYEYLGEQEVKNIERPVRVYRARLKADTVLPKPSMSAKRWRRSKRFVAVIVAGISFTIGVGVTIWWLASPSNKEPTATPGTRSPQVEAPTHMGPPPGMPRRTDSMRRPGMDNTTMPAEDENPPGSDP
ncbi:MAG: adenylate/guanylate cyclase domain-containing protein [Acidiferrobacterales bacterium]|nr:adenylate/guanylate cyclase domain-containing protein [Acidiferrobacterales bacterium]